MKGPYSLLLDMVLSSKDCVLCCQRDVCLRHLRRPQSSLCWESSKIVSFETRDLAKEGSWRRVWDTLHLDFYPDDPCEPL